MQMRKAPNHLTWRGTKTVVEAARQIAERKGVVLTLPWSYHHALCVRLSDAEVHGVLDVSGGPELLARLAGITGLHHLTELFAPVDLAGAAVRIHSPPPQVHLIFPGATGQQPRHAQYYRQESGTAMDAAHSSSLSA
jgi:hypothetical protein